MKGYVAKKGNRWYAVIYEGLDPVAGRERRTWHPGGTERADAEQLAARLARELDGRNDAVRSLTFGAFLTSRWLPGKRLVLADTTYDGYRRNVENHIVPALGRIPLRRLRPHHLESFYEGLLHPSDERRPLAPKTGYEMHLVIRGALEEAVVRGLLRRNVALVAHAPRLRSISKIEQKAWTADELQAFLRAAAGHRLFPALWLAAFTGMRRNELLGLRWEDLDERKATISINRGLVAVPYEVRITRGKTPRSRRRVDLDPTTVRRADRVALVAADRTTSRGRRERGMDVHRRPRLTDQPARNLTGVRAHRTSRLSSHPAIARSSPHAWHVAHRGRRTGEGRQRTTRARRSQLHHRHLPARHARHASRRGAHLRAARRARCDVGEDPREAPEEDRLNPVEVGD